jgi:MFS family permease
MQELYAVTTLRSLSTAMLWPPVMAWMARAVNPRQFARFLGSYNLSWATGTFFGFWGAGYLFEKISWPSPFWVSCCLAILLLIFVSIFSPRGGSGIALPIDAKAEHDHGLSPEQARFFVRQGLIMAGAGMLATSIGLYIFPKVAQGILSEVQISFLNSIRLVGQMAAFFMMGKFDAWHFRRWPVWTMTTIIILGLAILAAGQVYPHFIIGFLLIGVGFGAGFSMCAYYALGLSQKKGKGSGMMETMIGVGGLSGSLIGGATASLVSARAGLVSGFLPLILCSVFATLNPPAKKPD